MEIKILIFGCSARAVKLEEICSKIPEISIIGYVDNDEQKWGTEYLDRKVYSLKEFNKLCKIDNELNVLIISRFFSSIVNQLEEMRIKAFVSLYELLEEHGVAETYKGLFFLKSGEDVLNINQESEYLLIANGGLPKDNDLYRLGFVFRRLIAYREAGVQIDAFGYIDSQYFDSYEYGHQKIYEGGENGLSYLLAERRYKKILIHFPTAELMHVLEPYLNGFTEVICWLHGYEVLRWERRRFNYTADEIISCEERFEKESNEKMTFLRKLFGRKNFRFVFVSHWLNKVVKEDVGVLPEHYTIIPNYIDDDLFQYCKKTQDDMKKVFVVKSNKTRIYANDIVTDVILDLSKRDCFKDMEFNVYGNGGLFQENYSRLIDCGFSNVHIHQHFLSQVEIAQRHKENGIFLCPTRQDTQGVSMCEAMSSGMVVITNRVAAIPEYINDECGFLCDNENAKQMADAIEKLVTTKDMFIPYSQNAARYVRDKCGYKNTIEKELKLILCEGDKNGQ